MPVKRRKDKRRMGWRAELEAWAGSFEVGYDFFDEVGFGGSGDTARRSEFLETMAEAWGRLGGAYLEERVAAGKPLTTARRQGGGPLYALEHFGDPRCQ